MTWKGLKAAVAMGVFSAASLAQGVRAGDVRAVRTEELQRLVKEDAKQVFLLDVRTAGEVAGGRVPGSVHIPMNQIQKQLTVIPKDRKVVAICASGARSAAVARFLADNGYPWVANYEGGIVEWTRRGLPLQR